MHMRRGRLPAELRAMIRELTFPRVLHHCTRCGFGVIVQTMTADAITDCECFIDDDRRIVCSLCVNPNEALIDQTPRRGWARGAQWR